MLKLYKWKEEPKVCLWLREEPNSVQPCQFITRELKQRRFWATDVNRKFMFSLLACFHDQTMSYKALILAFTTWLFDWKGCNTYPRGEVLTIKLALQTRENNPKNSGENPGCFQACFKRNAFRDPRNSPEKSPEKSSGPRSFWVFWETHAWW